MKPSLPQLNQFLKVAVKAALTAGAIQKKNFGKTHSIKYKGEINIVTEVDQACEDKIYKILSKEFPDHEFLMEESGTVPAVNGGRSPSGANGETSIIRWG